MIEIKDQKTNQLLEREEIVATIKSTSKKDEIKKSLAEKTNSDPELIIIKTIKPSFGQQQSTIQAHIYKTKDQLKLIEEKKKKKKEKKEGEGSEEQTQEQQTEQPKQEKPAEEKKEAEKKEESKEKPGEKPEKKEEPKQEQK